MVVWVGSREDILSRDGLIEACFEKGVALPKTSPVDISQRLDRVRRELSGGESNDVACNAISVSYCASSEKAWLP
jgi:hypothetical protein